MPGRLTQVRKRAYLERKNRSSGAHRVAALGENSLVVPPATILSPHRIRIGDEVLVLEGVTFSLVEEHRGRRYEPSLSIGDRTLVGRDVWFSCVGRIEVGAEVLIGHRALIADSFHEYADRERAILLQPMAPPRTTRISDGASIGPGAAILSGATVGRGAYVAANAVVAGHVPDHGVAAGNPAEIIRRPSGEKGAWVDSEDPRWRDLLTSLTSTA